MAKKLNFYATINRSINNTAGTKIHLNEKHHYNLLSFLQLKTDEIRELHKTNPDTKPSFILNDEAWSIIRKELREKKGVDFTKIYYGETEICVICHNDYKGEIMETELLRVQAKEDRELKEKIEKQKEEE